MSRFVLHTGNVFVKFQKIFKSSNPILRTKSTITSTVNDKIVFEKKSFENLLRNSPLIQLGIPEGKVVAGEVIDLVEDDLYIDFGFKFNGICKVPRANSSSFVRGSKVKVRINSLELSDRFLGSNQDMTLLEADITLLGLINSPIPAKNNV